MWGLFRFTDWANNWPTWGGSGVADEAEAFVHGHLLERLADTGGSRWVQPWTWLNAAAHGTIDDLTDLVERRVPAEGGTWAPWRQAQSRLAREVLSRSCGDPAQLRRLQPDAGPAHRDVARRAQAGRNLSRTPPAAWDHWLIGGVQRHFLPCWRRLKTASEKGRSP